jgi:hypothetical protein
VKCFKCSNMGHFAKCCATSYNMNILNTKFIL